MTDMAGFDPIKSKQDHVRGLIVSSCGVLRGGQYCICFYNSNKP